MFKSKDGVVRFTEARGVVSRRGDESDVLVDITVYRTVQGAPEVWPAERLISDSDGVLWGVLSRATAAEGRVRADA
eukprot:6210523-Pleurochrysis_carterae.AAC.1